jgi:hypothetical protein
VPTGACGGPSVFQRRRASERRANLALDDDWSTHGPATLKEKPRLGKLMTAIWPAFDRYQARTKRDIPVIILERV